MAYTFPFEKLSRNDAPIAGGKGASLGEMAGAKIPVPPGFVVLAGSFDEFIKLTDLNVEIDHQLHSVDTDKIHTVENASAQIQRRIIKAKMPKEIADEILKSFDKLGAELVAVRSSATSEDSADAAWAGQLDSHMNITRENVPETVQRCWASLFTPRAIFYRFEKGLHKEKISVAVVVQKMVKSEISGIAFSVHPVTEDHNQIIIEAGWGFGDAVVSGSITPDSYVVEKSPKNILDVNVSPQERELVKKGENDDPDPEWGEIVWADVPAERKDKQKLSEKQIFELSELVQGIERHYGFPVDTEWAVEKDKFYITQSRPITTLTTQAPTHEGKKGGLKTETDNHFLRKFQKYLGNHEVLLIRGRYAPLFTSTWLIKNGDFPVYMANSAKESIHAVDRDVYIKYAKDAFEEYLKGEFGLDEFKKIYNSYVARVDKVYNDSVTKKLTKLTEKELIKRVKDTHDIFIDIVGDSLFIEFLTQESIDLVIKDSNFKALNVGALLDKSSGLSFDSFELRHQYIKINELKKNKNKITESLISKLKYLYTDYLKTKSIEEIKKDLKAHLGKKLPSLDFSKERKKVMKRLSNKETKLFEYFEYISQLRDYRKDHLAKTHATLQVLSEELCSRANIPLKDSLNIISTELVKGIDYLEDNKQEFTKRRNGLESFICGVDEIEIHSSEVDIDNIERMLTKAKLENKNEIHGDSANKGIARGKVRIIYEINDKNVFNKGDILVASMTRPEFVPLMKKAGGIVTNEGGYYLTRCYNFSRAGSAMYHWYKVRYPTLERRHGSGSRCQ